MSETVPKGLSSSQLRFIVIIAMTIDHLASVIFPGYPLDPGIFLPHIIDRLTTSIMCPLIVEGYHYTHNVKYYTSRLLLLTVISHFAYDFTFGIPFIPFQTTIFNQTSIIWLLAQGLVVLTVFQCKRSQLRPWMKPLALAIICVITSCSDWSCIAILIIVYNGQHRGDFQRQMAHMFGYVATYAAIYIPSINPVYGLLQMVVVLAILLLRRYNGTRGKSESMKWLLRLYYPLYLVLCGFLRIVIHGSIRAPIGDKWRTKKSIGP